MFDALERRALMSVSLHDHVLSVSAGDHPALVILSTHGDRIRVEMNDTMREYQASRVEQIRVTGSGGADYVDATALETLGIFVKGGGGNDTLVGTAHSDTLYGDSGRDVIYGSAGNDLLVGGRDRDELYGEDGNDYIIADRDDPHDFIDGGDGFDTARVDSSGLSSEDWIYGIERTVLS